MLTIATFWLSTAMAELFGSPATVIAVKTAIPWGFGLLVPALAVTGGSGFFLSRGQKQGLVGAKLKRMPFIAANGLLVLIPSALFLAAKAEAGDFDAAFWAAQALELVAGAVNLVLLGLGMRDGFRLTQWRRKSFLQPASSFTVRLLAREEIEGGLLLRVSKPEGFEFVAGQAVYVMLPNLDKADEKGRVRTFSLASAPQDDELALATRRGDSTFKQAIASVPLGSVLRLEGPYGDLTLHEDATRPAVFLAGGIGITPFRSMALDAMRHGLPHQLVLIYSNRRPKDAAFLSELRTLEQQNPRFQLITTFTDPATAANAVTERGPITIDMIAKYIGDLAAPVFYVAGPPTMVEAMEAMLRTAGVDEGRVRAEKFAGY